MRQLRLALLLGLALLLVFPTAAFASGVASRDPEGRVIVGGTYTLARGRVLSGDLVAIGAAAKLETESLVQGDVALIGGFLNADGTVEGDVFGLGGIITLGPTAVIHGDLVTIGAVVNRAEGAVVDGQVTEQAWSGFDLTGPGIILPSAPPWTQMPGIPWGGISLFNPLFSLGFALLRALAMAGLAVLVVMFWPVRTTRVAHALISQPAASGGIGLLTAFLAVLGIVVLAFTVCLIPFSFVGGLILAAGFVLGWIAIGLEVGIRLAEVFRRPWHPATQAGLGTLLLTFVASAFDLIPCVGFLVPVVLAMMGLGAVTLTRFGGQEALASAPSGGIPAG